MNFLQKLFYKPKEKSINFSGGISVLQKLVSPDLGTTQLMERYRKSLYVFACISKIAEKVGSIDINLYKISNSKGDVQEIKTHPALDLIYRPNKIQTKAEFLAMTIINKKTAGDAFWYKVRNNRGMPVELWNLRPDLMTIITDPVEVVSGYKFRKADGSEILFPPEDIIHFKDYPDPLNQYSGISALMPASIRVQTEEYATKYQRDFFLNSARPDAVLKSPKRLLKNQKSELRKGWNSRHRGVGNTSKIGLLEGGIEYQLISLNQKDMDYVEGTKMTRDDILVAFRMTKTVLGITDDVNRANAETAMAVFLSEVIVPEIKGLVEKINEEMAYIDYGENIFYGFNEPNLEDKEFRLKEDTELVKANILLPNEVREARGKVPMTGGWSFYLPIMQAAAGGLSASERAKMIKIIEKDSKTNEALIEKSKLPAKFEFKGRFLFQQKMKICEHIANQKIGYKEKGMKRKGGISMIQDEKIKEMYADMINKKIDIKAEKLSPAMSLFAMKQKARVVAELMKQKKSIKNKFKISTIFKEKEEIALTIDFIIPYIEEFLKEAGKESLLSIAPQEVFSFDSDRIQKFIDDRSKMFANSVTQTTLEGVEKTLAEGIAEGESTADLIKRVEEVYDDFPSYRSNLIARTEATAANNEGILESFRQSEVVNAKEWITAGDDKVRPEHAALDGEIVLNDENFSNGLPYPEEPNCRCVLGGAFVEE